jgi:CheY-like chemotaxis protein
VLLESRKPAISTETLEDIVLVVEDEVLLRMMLADVLRRAGFRVVEACNAHEALDLLGHGAANVKAVISDIRMPGSIDGVGLARTIRSNYPTIKVLLAAGHMGALDATEHDGFFQKTYDTAKIIRHVRQLLGHPDKPGNVGGRR